MASRSRFRRTRKRVRLPDVALMEKLQLKQAASRVRSAINDFVKREFHGELREHLGASVIGRDCDRQLWYLFRWVAKDDYRTIDLETGEYIDEAGRMNRLFQRGHAEEERMISYLRGTGIEVSERDESAPKKSDGNYPQYRISGVGGHFGGSLDGIVKLPEWVLGFTAMAVLEMKTHGKNSFKKLKEFGLGGLILGRNGKPYSPATYVKNEHVAQMDTYGTAKNIPYGLYVAIEKDTDDIHVELRETDRVNGADMFNRAEYIIRGKYAPGRLTGSSRTDFRCKFCTFKAQCHDGANPTEINCRSCKHATPQPGAQWSCGKRNAIIPPAVIPQACSMYEPVTHLAE